MLSALGTLGETNTGYMDAFSTIVRLFLHKTALRTIIFLKIFFSCLSKQS